LKALLRLLVAFLYPLGNIAVYDFFSVSFAAEIGFNIASAPIMFWLLSLGKSLFIIPEERNV
jgi:hypothetical protein